MISLFYSCEFSWSICLSCFQEVGKPFLKLFPHFQGVRKPFLRHFFSFGRGRNAVFAVSRFSAMAETHFFSFLSFRPRPKRGFCCFLLIRRGGKPIFSVFPVSAVAETLFLLFSIHPPRRKADFRVFCSSYPYERLFLPFFIDCTPTKRGFQRFLLVVGVRKTVFRRFLHFVGRRRALSHVFCVSSTDDKHFSAFSAFRRPTTSTFSRFSRFVSRRWAFSAFFGSPRGWKHIFSNFPLIRALGKPFFPIFCSSEVSDDHFFQFLPPPPIET